MNDPELNKVAEITENSEQTGDVPAENAAETAAEEVMTPEARRKQRRSERRRKRLRRLEVRRLRREYEQKQKAVPEDRLPLVCPPERAVRGRGFVIGGFVCRAIVIFFAVFGLVFFAADAFGIINTAPGDSHAGYIALWSFILTGIAVCAAALPRKAITVPAASLTVALITVTVLGFDNPIGNAAEAAVDMWNKAMLHLADVGYFSMAEKVSNYQIYSPESVVVNRGLYLAVLAISVIYACCLSRRIRIAGLTVAGLFSAGVLWVVFTYNISRSNWGVTLIICSFAALLVMFAYDAVFVSDRGRSSSGPDGGMFGLSDEPPLPEEYLSRKEIRAAERQKKKVLAAQRRDMRRRIREGAEAPRQVTVDEEISDYFSGGRNNRNRKAKDNSGAGEKLTAAQRKEKAAQRRLERAEKKAAKARVNRAVRANRRYRESMTDACCAVGGFAGVAMFALCMAVLLLPTLIINGSFRTVESIDSKFQSIREYVTALLMGDDPALDLLSYENDPGTVSQKSTDPVPLHFTGREMMTVESNYRGNVYLRGWVASDYDSGTGLWSVPVPGTDAFKTYRELFGTTVDPSETMMHLFFSLSDPASIPDDESYDYSSKSRINSSYGFAVSQVNMKRTGLDSKLLYMPSFSIRPFNVPGLTASNKDTMFLRAYGEESASKVSCANYFDGLFTTYRGRKDRDGYAAVAMIPTQKIPGWYRTLAGMIEEMDELIRAVEATGDRPEFVPSTNTRILSLIPNTYLKNPGAYVIKNGDGTEFAYRVEYRNSDGQPVTDDAVALYGDGFTYIVTELYDAGRFAGECVYKFNPEGSQIFKSVENIPEDMKYESDGTEITRVAPSLPLAVKYYEFYSDAMRGQLKYYSRVSGYYTDFVYGTYSSKSGSSIVAELAESIAGGTTETVSLPSTVLDPVSGESYLTYVQKEIPVDFSRAAERNADREVYIQRHRLVMALVDYLADEKNFTYTLNPAQTADSSLVGIEKFLAGSRQGYCVQYATALVLMLRELGIPARYVDGFIASDFNLNRDPDKAATYVTTVRDRNAHAWAEVWFDGVGWVQYEATPAYYGGLYVVNEDQPYRPSPIAGDDEPDPGDETDPADELTDEELAELIRKQQEEARKALIRKIVVITLSVTAAAAVVAAVLTVLFIRARRRQRYRDALTQKFASADPADPSSVPSRDEVREYGDLVMLLLSVCGLAPKTGEFRDEYADRIASHNPGALAKEAPEEGISEDSTGRRPMNADSVRSMLGAMAAEEFGYGADAADLPLMARFYRRIYAYEYRRNVSVFRRIYLWFIKAVL